MGRDAWICQPCHGMRFFERVLLAPFGFAVMPWQEDLIRRALALDFDTGLPVYKTVYVEIPKKNAKSWTSAFFPLYRLMFPLTSQVHCYGAASSRDQAGIVFENAAAMVRQSKLLAADFKVLDSTKRIVRRDGRGVYRVISSDGNTWDGVMPNVAVKDELHRWKTAASQALHHAINKGTISDPTAQVIEITTAGDPQSSPLWLARRQRAERALANPGSDSRFLAILHRANPDKVAADPDYWRTREARAEANPSHEDNPGGFLRDEAIVEQMADGESAYKRFHLNIPSQEEDRLLSLEDWHACAAPLRPLAGRLCAAGFDLSEVNDFTALSIIVPAEDGTFDLKVWAWVPEKRLAQLERVTHQPLRDWVKQGYLNTCTGDTIDYSVIHDTLDMVRDVARVHVVGYDRRFAHDLVSALSLGRVLEVQEGVVTKRGSRYLTEEINQRADGMTNPVNALAKMVKERKLRHEPNPCIDWMISCCSLKVVDNGGKLPDKSGNRATKADRIDAVSATLTAIGALMKHPLVRSGYERGIVFA